MADELNLEARLSHVEKMVAHILGHQIPNDVLVGESARSFWAAVEHLRQGKRVISPSLCTVFCFNGAILHCCDPSKTLLYWTPVLSDFFGKWTLLEDKAKP